MNPTIKRTVYRVEGFTCANCAAQFEQNVKKLPGVRDAEVNFGASKLTVWGEASVEELERAGAFENLRIYPDAANVSRPGQPPLWKRPDVIRTALSALALILGFLGSAIFGEESLFPSFAYLSAIVVGGYRMMLQGLKNLLHVQFDIRTLMTIAILGALAIGEWSEGAMVIVLFALSEALERFSMDRARQSIRSLLEIAPKEATVRRGGREITIPVSEIEIGDLLRVKPGQKIAADGRVLAGQSTVNEAPITGESLPVLKKPGDVVYAGTLNGEGFLEIAATRRAEDTTLAKIIHLVEEAQAKRAPTQAFVDRFARYYTPAILILALFTAVLPPLLLGGDWSEWLYRGLALLVVGCPCALVISTPVAIVTGIGKAAKNGVLIKGGAHLETAAKLTQIAFDKTGTLTLGKPVVTDVLALHGSWREHLAIAAAMERQAHHPLADSIVQKALQEGVAFDLPVRDFASVTGKGLHATVDGRPYFLGSTDYLQEVLQTPIDPEVSSRIRQFQKEGKTVVALGTAESLLCLFAVADPVRESSAKALQRLKELGIQQLVMLTGDQRETAEAVAGRLPVDRVDARLLPEQKLKLIEGLKPLGTTAMVGDGVNDAPALAAADLGIAMGGAGSDTALETADVVLMADDLKKLPFFIRLSRKTLGIIRQNIAFSIGIKLLAFLLIFPGWLTLWMAVFADMGATLIVTLNALRLLNVNPEE